MPPDRSASGTASDLRGTWSKAVEQMDAQPREAEGAAFGPKRWRRRSYGRLRTLALHVGLQRRVIPPRLLLPSTLSSRSCKKRRATSWLNSISKESKASFALSRWCVLKRLVSVALLSWQDGRTTPFRCAKSDLVPRIVARAGLRVEGTENLLLVLQVYDKGEAVLAFLLLLVGQGVRCDLVGVGTHVVTQPAIAPICHLAKLNLLIKVTLERLLVGPVEVVESRHVG